MVAFAKWKGPSLFHNKHQHHQTSAQANYVYSILVWQVKSCLLNQVWEGCRIFISNKFPGETWRTSLRTTTLVFIISEKWQSTCLFKERQLIYGHRTAWTACWTIEQHEKQKWLPHKSGEIGEKSEFRTVQIFTTITQSEEWTYQTKMLSSSCWGSGQ